MKRWLFPVNLALSLALVGVACLVYLAWRPPSEPAMTDIQEARESKKLQPQPAKALPSPALVLSEQYEPVWKESLFRENRSFPEAPVNPDGLQAMTTPKLGLRGIVVDDAQETRKAYFETSDTQPTTSPDPRQRVQPEPIRQLKAYEIGAEVRAGWRLKEIEKDRVLLAFGTIEKQIILGKASELNNLEPLVAVALPTGQPGGPVAVGQPRGGQPAPTAPPAPTGPGIYVRQEGRLTTLQASKEATQQTTTTIVTRRGEIPPEVRLEILRREQQRSEAQGEERRR